VCGPENDLGGAVSFHRGTGEPPYRNGTRTIKIFLHLSKEEQRKRFLEGIDEPNKNWRFSLADIHERKYWKQYMQAYGACLSATSTRHAPWYVVPADDKENARLIVSRILLDALNELKMAYPKTTAKRRLELKSIRKLLVRDIAESPACRTSRDPRETLAKMRQRERLGASFQ
jgi:hypothetical protein